MTDYQYNFIHSFHNIRCLISAALEVP